MPPTTNNDQGNEARSSFHKNARLVSLPVRRRASRAFESVSFPSRDSLCNEAKETKGMSL